MNPSAWIRERGKLILIIIGLSMMLIGQAFRYEFLKVRLDDQIANLGSLLIFVGVLQWLLDDDERRELIGEIVAGISGSDALFKHGIVRSTLNTKEIAEPEEWESASVLMIGVHYDSRFITDRSDLIRKRIRDKKTTVVFHVKPAGIAAQYLKGSSSGISDIKASIEKLHRIKETDFGNSPYLVLKEMDRVLRYVFTYCDTSIWVRFVTNSAGRVSALPAIKVAKGSPLFEFFKDDIMRIS